MIEYDLTWRFDAGWVDAWDDVAWADHAQRGGELFARTDTLRYRWEPDQFAFRPYPAAQPPYIQSQFAMVGSPDTFLNAHLAKFLELAQTAEPGRRAWLRLFLSDCAPSEQRGAVEEALNAAEQP